MLKRITIQGYKSYPHDTPTHIDLDNKRVALFYGLNGSGKSAIGEVIHHNGNNLDPFPNCSLTTLRNESFHYLVYNDEFIEATFRNRNDMPGIFTIGRPEAAELAEAEALERETEQLGDRIGQLTEQKRGRETEAERALNSIYDAVWPIYTDHIDGPLGEWLAGFGNSKKKLFNQVNNTPYNPTDLPSTLEDLTARMSDVADRTASPRPEVWVDVGGMDDIEGDLLWAQAIVGSGDSTLAAQIQALGNMDWVRQGRTFLGHGSDCPFCQQNLPHDFSDELSKLFDTSFENRLNQVQARTADYARRVDVLHQTIDRIFDNEPFSKEHPDLERVWAQVRLILSNNLNDMLKKHASPSQMMSLTPSRDALQGLIVAINEVNQRVQQFNARINDRDNELKRIRDGFWRRMRHDYASTFDVYQSFTDASEQAIQAIINELTTIEAHVRGANLRLAQLRGNTAGTDKAVEAINRRLASLGVVAFKITKANANLYHLQRNDGGVDNYRSLSEGEKTLITFLYFVELINGSADADTTVPLDKKIVVIDDPISSLSHNYVYDVASIIVHGIIGLKDGDGRELKQIVVLTHSLFFHHELTLAFRYPKKVNFKRVLKHSHSVVVPMSHKDLLNDYEAYWQIIRDARTGQATSIMVANAMRCICERFFYFTRRQNDFKDALARIGELDNRFSSLARYLNRQSHADGENVTDFGDYDIAYYLDKFRMVFEHAGQMEHFRAMMKDDDDQGAADGTQSPQV